MRALWNGRILADSEQTLEVDGYHYFPRDTVRMDLLRIAAKTPRDRQCPHGVQFYDVTDGTQRGERCAWSYEAPGESMKKVDHWIGFWDQVEVEAS
ncbi:MAG TPA: DUF427 domain-containing protein [Planctomycetota bacterium]|nr:DUF427 domain-containing protein [Planctomycetota bacterium]